MVKVKVKVKVEGGEGEGEGRERIRSERGLKTEGSLLPDEEKGSTSGQAPRRNLAFA